MKKRFFILSISLCLLLPVTVFTIINKGLFAAGTIINSPSNQAVNSLHTGDEVHLGTASDDVYNVLGQKDGYVYLIKKNPINTITVNFNTAKTNATNFVSDANFGKVGKAHAQTGLISKTDLNSLSVVSGNNLVSSIPSISGNWWLADNNTSTNRASFASASNALNADSGIKKTTVSGTVLNSVTGGTCSNVSTGEKGVMPINNFNAASVVKSKYVSSGKIHFDYSGFKGKKTTAFDNNSPGTCSSGSQGMVSVSTVSLNMQYAKDSNGVDKWTKDKNGALVGSLISSFGWRPTILVDANGNFSINQPSKTVTTTAGQCLYSFYSGNGIYVDPKTSSNKYVSYKYAGNVTFTTYASVVGTPAVQTNYCPTLTNNAGTALVRPYVKVKASDIIMRNNAKRTYATASVLNDSSIPSSDNAGSFLTLQTSKLSVGLNSGSVGVSGNTYEVEKPKTTTTVSLPLTFGAEFEGTRYVAAEAVDNNGDTVYSVLGTVGSGNTANVNIDYANLLAPNSNTFKVTLYLEDAGGKNTAYRSNGTEITVKLKEPQYIRYTAGNAGTVTYGKELKVNAELYDYETLTNGDIKQSDSDLTFTINAADVSKAYIKNQTYNKITGKAEAIIVPLTGTGSFELSIMKNGDDTYFDAAKQSVTIQLNKKPLTLVPSNPPGITATLGDMMPSLEPEALIVNTGDGIVSGDVVPSELYPSLERVDIALAEHPAKDGVIENPGSWKMLFPDPSSIVSTAVTQFTNKYDLSFEDYDDDNDYVFTVDPDGILERWIEIYSPQPKINGWYHTPVTLRPSLEAKYFGYFDIALVTDGVDGVFDSAVLLTDDTSGMKPIVKLKKTDGEISHAKQLNTKIKIDQTKPAVNLNIPSGWANLKKTVQIQAIDATSGIDTTDSNSVKASFVKSDGTREAITLTNNGGGSYQFDATKNGLYEFVIKDRAGNEFTTFKNISQIDMTPASITATLGSLSADGDYHEIDVTRVEPDSGINYIQVYFQGDGDSALNLVGYLNRTSPTQTYKAPMNGRYEFRMGIGTGDVLTADVLVADITQIRPVVGMNAINVGDNSAYIDDTWINQDIKVTLSNLNPSFSDPLVYQYRRTSDTDWIDLSSNVLDITTSTFINDVYEFRAKGADTESLAVTLNVKIDKEKPQPPVMNHAEQLDDAYTFIDKAEISGSLLPKASGISQSWEYSLDDGLTWIAVSDNKFEINGAGDYDLQVRTLDEAGNISDVDSYPVHIKGKAAQTIEFDDVPAFVTYGSDVTIKAKLTSDLDEQADTMLIFTIPTSSSNKMAIIAQGYDPDTGEAWATLHPKNGDVFFDIEIAKDGDDKAFAATVKSKTIALHKAPLTIHPQIIYGKVVGDVMPALTSVGTTLVNSDTIPSALTITLTPDASTSDPLPTDSGNPLITHAGTWTMTYPENILTSSDLADFVKKYDITLEDYQTNTDYVFTTSLTGIPDSWIIVSPNANSEGWNNGDVTLSLSDDAIAAGYTTLALIEHGVETKFGTNILLDSETMGMTPVVVLKKPSETSGFKSLRYVKIDKSKPVVNITVDHENDWMITDKKVTIQVSDTLSGMKDTVVTDHEGNPITLTAESASVYSFISDNGNYHLKATDKADNVFESDFVVAKIDKTAPTISATRGSLSTDSSYQEINVVATVGDSGVQSYNVYYKEHASDAYPTTPTQTLNPSDLTCVFKALKNGFYRFEIVNQANQSADAEVEITDVIAAYPVVDLQAEVDDGIHTPYIGGTWVNKDVHITLSNTNPAISEAITYQYKKSGDTTWIDLDSNQLTIEESAWQNETYEFRGVISSGEGGATTINIRIDKEKPRIPTIENADQFTTDNAFGAPLTIKGSTTPKDSGIGQTIYISKDHGITWEEMSGDQYTITSPNTYDLLFKTVDEAGNESDESEIHHVNVNDGTPLITIKLNNNLLKDMAKSLTFGYFFKDSVDVDIEVEWYGMGEGDIYYILDDSETPSVPTDADPRWTSGDHTSIDPDRKTMIYAKAVNSDGKTAMTSSTYFVYADETAPEITFDKNYDNWLNDNTLKATISDVLSGVANDTISAKIDHSDKGEIEVKGSSLNFASLPDGSYKLQVSAEDNSGNKADETITVKIDTTAPQVKGVKDQSVYHQYYLPRYISVEDKHSGVASATLVKDGGEAEAIHDEIKVKDIGSYTITTKDQAGNEGTLSFKIVPLPDIRAEIDCSEESKKIIEQIENEYLEAKDQMDQTERDNIQKWLDDAHDIRNTCRIKIVYNEDKSAWVEGIGDTDFAADVVMMIDEIDESSLPKLPNKARVSYNVYLRQGDKVIEPNGNVRVHLPYTSDDDKVILYEIDDSNHVTEKDYVQNESHLVFDANSLEKYAITVKDQGNGTDSDKPDTPDNPDKPDNPNNPEAPDKTCKLTVNQDTDGDRNPDINIDIDGDDKADLNIDTDCDGIPDINIDTNGDGKPDYNVDTDDDGKADINMGPLPKPWKPNVCVTVQKVHYCTMDSLTAHINIDTDGDGRPDVNLDIDGDRLPDLNIDADGDLIPDVDIDIDGDGKPDINIDLNGDGVADINLLRLSKWQPEANYTVNGFAYDTMNNLKPKYNIDTDGDGKADKNIVDNTNNRYNLSGSDSEPDLVNRVNTGDYTKLLIWILLLILAVLVDIYCIIRHHRQKSLNHEV